MVSIKNEQTLPHARQIKLRKWEVCPSATRGKEQHRSECCQIAKRMDELSRAPGIAAPSWLYGQWSSSWTNCRTTIDYRSSERSMPWEIKKRQLYQMSPTATSSSQSRVPTLPFQRLSQESAVRRGPEHRPAETRARPLTRDIQQL